jgi:hypothetical protein
MNTTMLPAAVLAPHGDHDLPEDLRCVGAEIAGPRSAVVEALQR